MLRGADATGNCYATVRFMKSDANNFMSGTPTATAYQSNEKSCSYAVILSHGTGGVVTRRSRTEHGEDWMR